ncbi:MAG TPA: Rrf2 family transcriptional regulator [Candidatus Woesebacteria bacterium]|nr:Rrf2 family transcriptional regulator [Candidatus Woesebacteria bacterium]HPJ17233.1 Rrf2 family transcriptional regulator [Candidatus Woesebacteria bacterium]
MISLSKKIEYGIVLIKYLSKKADKPVSLSDVAARMKLPYRFLSQIGISLKNGGLVISKEGKTGGYILSKDWQKYNLYDLIVILGEEKHLVDCLGNHSCPREDECQMKKVWLKIEDKIVKEFKKFKLKEL